MDWQKIAIIISALTFLRLIVKDFIDIHKHNQSKKSKRKASKTSAKSRRRKR